MTSTPGSASPTPGTTLRSSELRLLRFDRGERVLHWLNATCFLTLLLTGAALYVPALSSVVARRHLMKTVHVAAGLALPVPLVLTVIAGRWGAAFRADVRRLNRFSTDDRRWLRSLGRDRRARQGKFNAGQKLNAAFTAGAIPVMLATGSILAWPRLWPLGWRTGATFVHDWMFLGLAATITGHILFAVNDPFALRSMVRGHIPSSWARRHAPRWLEEEEDLEAERERQEELTEGTRPPPR
jgi:formate dehydrogenase subunit gamma